MTHKTGDIATTLPCSDETRGAGVILPCPDKTWGWVSNVVSDTFGEGFFPCGNGGMKTGSTMVGTEGE